MITPNDLIANCIEIQSDVCYCYYDVEQDKRVIISQSETLECEINYIYCINNVLYIEVSQPD